MPAAIHSTSVTSNGTRGTDWRSCGKVYDMETTSQAHADTAPVFIILGATGGIGSALSHRLAQGGSKLVVAKLIGRSRDFMNNRVYLLIMRALAVLLFFASKLAVLRWPSS